MFDWSVGDSNPWGRTQILIKPTSGNTDNLCNSIEHQKCMIFLCMEIIVH